MFDLIKLLFKTRNRDDLDRLYIEGRHYVRSKHPQKKVWAVIRHLFLAGIGFTILYPILYMISNSIKPQIENYDPAVI